jgi:hypothetical protein
MADVEIGSEVCRNCGVSAIDLRRGVACVPNRLQVK